MFDFGPFHKNFHFLEDLHFFNIVWIFDDGVKGKKSCHKRLKNLFYEFNFDGIGLLNEKQVFLIDEKIIESLEE